MRAISADTGGAFAVLEHTGERGYVSPLHLHEAGEETFLVLEGTLRVEVGADVHGVGAGGLALLTRGLAHGFVVTSLQARFLTLHTPAGFDSFVADRPWSPEPGGRATGAARHARTARGPATGPVSLGLHPKDDRPVRVCRDGAD